MARWGLMLGGLIVWAVHFFGVYTLASAGEVAGSADDPAWRLAIVAFSLLCHAAAAGLLFWAVREIRRPGPGDATANLIPELAALGAGVSLIAMAWQTLPAIVAY